jgi:hypothetical protein
MVQGDTRYLDAVSECNDRTGDTDRRNGGISVIPLSCSKENGVRFVRIQGKAIMAKSGIESS